MVAWVAMVALVAIVALVAVVALPLPVEGKATRGKTQTFLIDTVCKSSFAH